MLNDIDETVRKNAVISISGMLDCPGAIQALINKFRDINGHVRREACSAMANTGSSEIIEPLFGVIAAEPYGDVREAAATVLAKRKDPAITKRLLEMLDDVNSRIRETISKTIWQCVTSTKGGKKLCPDSKGIPEQVIEEAFIESYRLLCSDNQEVMNEFLSSFLYNTSVT